MMRFEKWVQKDRYGVVRGTLLLGVVMLLCTSMVIRLFYSYDIISEKERARDAVLRVTGQFEHLIDNSIIQLSAAAALIDESAADADLVLKHMAEHGMFSEINIVTDITECSDEDSFLRYEVDSFEAEIYPGMDGRIQFCVQMDDSKRLVGRLSAEAVESVLCDAFVEDYGYAVFNAASGAYILNNTALDDDGYFEALLNLRGFGDTETLINSGEAQARIERRGANAGDYYIAQNITKIRPLGIALVIPGELVQSDAWSGRIIPHATIAAATLMLIILISYTAFSLRRVYVSNKNAAKALETGENMMDVISHEAKITLFIYRRRQDVVLHCYDGLSLFNHGKISYPNTLRDIEVACGMDDAESDRLHECFRDLAMGENSEVLIHTGSSDDDERVFRLALCAPLQEEQGVICCISDCTQEQDSLNRIELERSYQASVEAKTSSVWQINITGNLWCVLSVKRESLMYKLKDNQHLWGDYSADLDGLMRRYLHPADYSDFADTMNVSSMASMYRNGKTEFTKDYRICRDGGADYEWHRMNIRIWLNPDTSEIFANIYVFNVNAEKNAELERGERKRVLHQTLMALGGLYYGLYYVDLENNLSYTARSLGGDLVTQLCAPYKETFDGYINSAVHPEDREALRSMLSAYQLRKHMTEGSHFKRREYRRKSGDSYEQAAIIVQPARFENGIVKEIVLAIRYIGRDKNIEL